MNFIVKTVLKRFTAQLSEALTTADYCEEAYDITWAI